MTLWQYVQENAMRGACQCGRCIDAFENPEDHQPEGHTVDMVFFEVAKSESATREDFEKLVEAEFPHWLEADEMSYIQMGADIGDQGAAMMAMALGAMLGTWNLFTPKMLGVSGEKATELAGRGLLIVTKRIDQ